MYMRPSGCGAGVPYADCSYLLEPGTNGLLIDREGRLLACEHGRRRVVRHEKSGEVTVLASHHSGARLNSPNDLTFAPNGDLCVSHRFMNFYSSSALFRYFVQHFFSGCPFSSTGTSQTRSMGWQL